MNRVEVLVEGEEVLVEIEENPVETEEMLVEAGEVEVPIRVDEAIQSTQLPATQLTQAELLTQASQFPLGPKN
jgi:hypothetical protein